LRSARTRHWPSGQTPSCTRAPTAPPRSAPLSFSPTRRASPPRSATTPLVARNAVIRNVCHPLPYRLIYLFALFPAAFLVHNAYLHTPSSTLKPCCCC
jgi:hypothetical protein